jgi:hypothetical protein
MRTFISLLAALALAATSLTPAAADARDRRGYYDNRHHGHHGYYRDHDDDGDAVAAGVIGLVLGLAIGSLASQPRGPDCYNNYRRCPPPRRGDYDPRYGDPRYGDPRGYDDSGLEGGYDPRYEDPRAAYERDYGRAPEGAYDPYAERAPQCTRRERQWDRYANRYVVVDVPC